MSSSRVNSRRSNSCINAVAVTVLDTDAHVKTVSGVTGTPRPVSAVPATGVATTRPFLTIAAERPGTPSSSRSTDRSITLLLVMWGC